MTKSQSGFTLVELVITVAVLAILVAIAVPSFAAVMRSTQVASRANQFMAAVNLARSDALRTNSGAGICASVTSTTCSASAADWNTGWLVYDDANGNGTFDAGETVLRVDQAAAGVSLSVTSATPPANIAFNSRGINAAAAATNVTFQLKPNSCPTGYPGMRNFTLLTVGQIIMTQANCP